MMGEATDEGDEQMVDEAIDLAERRKAQQSQQRRTQRLTAIRCTLESIEVAVEGDELWLAMKLSNALNDLLMAWARNDRQG
jgi:hypothetical protein